ncbi:DNA repair protein RecN [Hanstruepera neustonica]|uniref:DNA repair protein RecN n=1 Tax=Hanstruepera neustonica TaxID=1445657 RepID=A0A2K1DXF2_9FLAO|nr:DNA repair protein RecN [Hanstruepera neustonica]PNQ72683.1 DNA repair protein RecN [Hanstruepera neustonica]
MLTSLSIKNYALIDSLQVNFNQGLTIITGETGAGKSILLGGLSLILGKRADLSALKKGDEKCIIEAVFDVTNYQLESLFQQLDFDYESQTIIRREILPSGKSRAFVNDSPVNLSGLQTLGNHLIDIHSQHETMQLVDDDFQFRVIDALAKNENCLERYKRALVQHKSLQKAYDALLNFQSEALKEQDYNTFLLNELQDAHLKTGELEELEEQYETLNNLEEIKQTFESADYLLNDEQIGAIGNLTQLKNNLQRLSKYASKYDDLFNRVNSSIIELNDIFDEINTLQDHLDLDTSQIEGIGNRIDLLSNLLKKHHVETITDLIEIRNGLSKKVLAAENIDADMANKEQEVQSSLEVLNTISQEIHDNRKLAIPRLSEELEKILNQLGMPNAQFNIQLILSDNFHSNGKDNLQFQFKANKGGNFNDLKKAASGGELSRIMLAIKLILSNYVQLPSIVFDEIDSGVSGEISNKMGDIMLQMSNTMQVFTITHLPQIAAKGHTHFKVYKEDVDQITQTSLNKLDFDARIVEIAQMLGGEKISNSAIAHAKQLLN